MTCVFTEDVNYAAFVLRKGGIVAFPTETYYGLAVDIFNENAVEKLFELKRRDTAKPLLVLIQKEEQLETIVQTVPSVYIPLFKRFWPGPLTLIFPASKNVSTVVTGNTGSIGIRISSNTIANELVTIFDSPITATSANISGLQPAKNHHEIYAYFGDSLDCVLTGKTGSLKRCSTIISQEQGQLRCVRKGVVSFEEVLRCVTA